MVRSAWVVLCRAIHDVWVKHHVLFLSTVGCGFRGFLRHLDVRCFCGFSGKMTVHASGPAVAVCAYGSPVRAAHA